ncbi:hypothetical protein HanRHA438_Chr16g0756191 [Helianthus annuus]|nr:hypothetical protein HanIR_Chr16g0809041 [Helianthus annuus]KAJ0835515.1 hypothetical protein HanRHA438_Chr16g0756191 [Helianthus annuus]
MVRSLRQFFLLEILLQPPAQQLLQWHQGFQHVSRKLCFEQDFDFYLNCWPSILLVRMQF